MYCCRAAALLASIAWSLDPFDGPLFDFLWLILLCGKALVDARVEEYFVLCVKRREERLQAAATEGGTAGSRMHSSRMAHARHDGHSGRPMALRPRRCSLSGANAMSEPRAHPTEAMRVQQLAIHLWRGTQYNNGANGKVYVHVGMVA